MDKYELIKKLRDIQAGLSMYIASDPIRFRVHRAQMELDDLVDQLREEAIDD